LGVQDKHGAAVTLDRLMGNTFIELNPHALGLYIPYDEIYFGKPNADLYIDDKAFNPYVRLFESIGFTNILTAYEQEIRDKN
jgi:hypothetical protein